MKQLLDNWLTALQTITLLVVLIWLVAVANHLSGYLLSAFGLLPREPQALFGILFWIVLHGSFEHLLMNTTPLFVMGFFVALRGPWLFFKITVTVWLIAGIAVWLFGRPAYHIGASGLVFGYFGFILAIAVYERSLVDLAVASFTIFYYGGLIFGVLPIEQFVSWESHLFGLLAGIFAARLFSRAWVGEEGRNAVD